MSFVSRKVLSKLNYSLPIRAQTHQLHLAASIRAPKHINSILQHPFARPKNKGIPKNRDAVSLKNACLKNNYWKRLVIFWLSIY